MRKFTQWFNESVNGNDMAVQRISNYVNYLKKPASIHEIYHNLGELYSQVMEKELPGPNDPHDIEGLKDSIAIALDDLGSRLGNDDINALEKEVHALMRGESGNMA